MNAPAYIAVIAAIQILLGIHPATDRLTWFLENVPVWIGCLAIGWTWKRHPLSELCLVLLLIHSVILAVGGYYSYANVPLGFWMEDWFGFERNHYDRIGHFAQGFVPAILIRELLIRGARLPRSPWLPALAIAGCLAFSAFYELIEWWTAVFAGDSSTEFLGTQGDVWDAQWDMFLALIGAAMSLLLLSRLHDRSLKRLEIRREIPRTGSSGHPDRP